MASEYTPGPWRVKYFSGDHGRATVEQDRGEENTGRYVPVAGVCQIYGHARYGEMADTAVANAHLIAASPDMHDALTDIIREAYTEVPTIGWTELMQQALEKGREALRKAKGETNGG